jgi:hypothetical protein
MNNKPTHFLYNVIDQSRDADDDKHGIWTRVGAAWPHGDGKGFSITPDIPMIISVDTRLVLRERDEQSNQTLPPKGLADKVDDQVDVADDE